MSDTPGKHPFGIEPYTGNKPFTMRVLFNTRLSFKKLQLKQIEDNGLQELSDGDFLDELLDKWKQPETTGTAHVDTPTRFIVDIEKIAEEFSKTDKEILNGLDIPMFKHNVPNLLGEKANDTGLSFGACLALVVSIASTENFKLAQQVYDIQQENAALTQQLQDKPKEVIKEVAAQLPEHYIGVPFSENTIAMLRVCKPHILKRIAEETETNIADITDVRAMEYVVQFAINSYLTSVFYNPLKNAGLVK